jgi:ABC-type oligopeptide transport system substrate-binding subunit
MLYNGPFKQVGWTGSNLSWKMVKNPYYWDKKNVKLDTITWSVQKTPSTAYNLYQSNKLDATALDSSQTKQLKNQKGYTELNQGSTFYLQFNIAKNKYLANANVRKALSLAVNRKGLTTTLGGNNQPADTLTPTQLTNVNGEDYTKLIPSSAETLYPTNPNKSEAVKYMNKGLKELGVSKFSFKILSDDTDSGNKTTEASCSPTSNQPSAARSASACKTCHSRPVCPGQLPATSTSLSPAGAPTSPTRSPSWTCSLQPTQKTTGSGRTKLTTSWLLTLRPLLPQASAGAI